MAKFIDFQLEQGKYGKAVEYDDVNSIILAIRNILLSKPGNFPFNPSIGMDIRKYQFDILDDETIETIQKELNQQIAKYIPDISNVYIYVDKVLDENGTNYLCFSIGSSIDGEDRVANFVMSQNGEDVRIFNEIR